MATKRPAEDQAAGSGGPPAKKSMTRFDPVSIGRVYNLEELDMKVLKFQNKKLVERIELRRRAEDELRKRIDQLENRQRTDDAVLMIVNRYWNLLDEDARVLLQRFDAETADETETKNESDATTAFLTLLSTWDKQELEQRLGQRVEFSKRAIGKLLQAFDRLLQRNEKLNKAIQDKVETEAKAHEMAAVAKEITEVKIEPEVIDIKKEVTEPVKVEGSEVKTEAEQGAGDVLPAASVTEEGETEEIKPETTEVKEETDVEVKEEAVEEMKEEVPEEEDVLSLRDVVQNELVVLQQENKQIHNMVTHLHARHHEHTLKVSELQDKLTAAETEIAELKNKMDDLEYNFEKADSRAEKLDRHLADACQKLQSYQDTTTIIPVEGGKSITGVSKNKFDEIIQDLEEQRELATNRMTELEKLSKEHQEALTEIEKLKMDLQHLPESVIVETTEYKCLQSQYSVLYNDNMQFRTQIEESSSRLQNSKNTHLRHLEQMESDELGGQKKLRGECIQLEDALAQVRKEYEMLRIEFEQTLAQNEQTGPINHEMRNLIQSLQKHNQQLKSESGRYRRRAKEAQAESAKFKAELAANEQKPSNNGTGENSGAASAHSNSGSQGSETVPAKDQVPSPPTPTSSSKSEPLEPPACLLAKEEDKDDLEYREKGKTDLEVIKDLRSQLKQAQASQKELKLLLDMYKSAPKEQRDKVQLMASEKKARQEIEELKTHIKKMQETERKERRKLAEEDAIRKIKKMEETITELQKNLTSQKQKEEALLDEMEVTGQAFEDMQEQNTRLLQQLKEKDDANFKLMSERIKSNQIQKLLREEKEVLADQVNTIHSQVEAQNIVVRKLEEKEQILQNTLSTIEKELGLTQQAMEMHKRKAVESSQTAADLKLHLDKYQAQLKEATVLVAEKTGALEQEAYKHKRMQEEIAKLQRKLERTKKIEMAGAADEVLMAEIAEYKEQLTCPSCKVNRKDAVLTKCFHVFCLECLKTRYETRQRKCPKCNAGFGANDYHRLYLA
ncbi:E3 ubiquitin-protein ligase Bre1-like [Ylistrum balloti]|uniref:E3 ubiquitin-protein ligase Bre1-like n=1 Tax=Ylistrum balloti TaxID=509963 RepID=UPI002905D991|nr:E3 ubiquitin-protein ligase Bre1-like [Ylistrum balloti]